MKKLPSQCGKLHALRRHACEAQLHGHYVVGTTMDVSHPDEHCDIHRLRKLTDMYGYGCEVMDIHGYVDVTHSLPAAKVVQIVIYMYR